MSAPDKRIAALRRFAASITAFTILGNAVLGFENPWAQPLLALAVAYPLELGLERLDAWGNRRPPRYAGGPRALMDFLLPAHITALSIALLLYAGEDMTLVVFAVALAVCSKFVFRVRIDGKRRHFLNPSNFALSVTFLAFPAATFIPYQFTENIAGAVDWVIPAAIAVAGTTLNAKLTGKGPLILGFVGGFIAQALLRAAIFGTPVVSGLLPFTGVVLILYINYMITDPGTTPVRWRSQVAFGAATAALYGVFVVAHVVYGLFFALTIVSALRGLGLAVVALRQPQRAPEPRSPQQRALEPVGS